MAAKTADNRVFDHDFQITQTGKGYFTKPVDHNYMCLLRLSI